MNSMVFELTDEQAEKLLAAHRNRELAAHGITSVEDISRQAVEVQPDCAQRIEETIKTGHFAEFPIVEAGLQNINTQEQRELQHDAEAGAQTMGANFGVGSSTLSTQALDKTPTLPSQMIDGTAHPSDNETLSHSETLGTPLKFPDAAPPTFKDYDIIKEIGRSKRSRVYLASSKNPIMDWRQRAGDKRVAIKVFCCDTAHSFLTKLIHDEFSIAAKAASPPAPGELGNPHIVSIYEFIPSASWCSIVMEFIEGADLYALVKKNGALSPKEACEYISQAAQGLQNAFRHNIVHGDIKPSNLMLQKDFFRGYIVKIIDFGQSRIRANAIHFPYEGTTVIGTPDYVAPEQMRDYLSADIRSDIYSLGCTFLFLLTGAPALRSDIPPALGAIIAKMIAMDPNDRFQEPIEVAHALEPFLRRITL